MKKRIIIKVGTKVLSGPNNTLDTNILAHLVEQIITLKESGLDIILVTSGAVGAGRGLITLKNMEKVAERQVLAAIGQAKLMSIYSELFGKKNKLCAQVLATKEDFRDRTHYLNMRSCFDNLLASGVIPIVNENDVVATTELLFTDNDELAGLVASQLNTHAVVILTSVDGFLTGEPDDLASKVIPEVDLTIISSLQKYISPDKTEFGRGGMLTKFNIAKKLALQGITVFFANGKKQNVLTEILLNNKSIGTKFIPKAKSSALKRRIAYSAGLTKGVIQTNICAEELLLSKTQIMSLLPIGVIGVEGNFEKGDIVEIIGESKKKLGYGIAEYGTAKARELMGKKNVRPIIHYNHMFIEG